MGKRLIQELKGRRRASDHLQPNDGYEQQTDHPNQGYRDKAALAYHREQSDQQQLGTTLMSLGAIAGEQGDFAHALPWLEEALTLLRGVDNPQELGFVLLRLGYTLHKQGDLGRARILLEECVVVNRNAGFTEVLTAQALTNLGAVVVDLGDDA